jgi:hypothetical protein
MTVAWRSIWSSFTTSAGTGERATTSCAAAGSFESTDTSSVLGAGALGSDSVTWHAEAHTMNPKM